MNAIGPYRIAAAWALCAALAAAGCGAGAPERPPGNACPVVYVDAGILSKAFENYTPIPTRKLIPGHVAAIRITRMNRVEVQIENLLSSAPLEAGIQLRIDGEPIGSQTLAVPPGESATLAFDTPVMAAGEHRIEVTPVFSRPGELPPGEASLDFAPRTWSKTFDPTPLITVKRVDFDVDIDGDLRAWANRPALTLGNPGGFPDAIRATLHLGWDDENLYLAVSVADPAHFNERDGANIWDGDALQFVIVPVAAVDAEPFNIGLALAAGQARTHQWMGPDTRLLQRSEYAVVRDNEAGKTYYEMKIPLACLNLGSGVAQGALFGFNAAVFNDNDGSGQDYWVQITEGLAGGFDPTLYRRFVLWK